jgi:hypothetical protein
MQMNENTNKACRPGSNGNSPLPLPAADPAQAWTPAPGAYPQPTFAEPRALTVERILATLLGCGPVRVPTDDFWQMFKIWRKTLQNAGVRHEKGERGWTVDIELLTPATIVKACSKAAFRAETNKAAEEAIGTLTAVFAHDPAKLDILSRLEGPSPR